MLLDYFETGYEGKFDFPPRMSAPETTYLLASVPRAGSTHFSHVLWRAGCLGAPLEYLNFEPRGPYGFAANSIELQQELWRSVLRRRCSPNGVFGLKVFAPLLEELQQRNRALFEEALGLMLPRDRRRLVVYLRRRDRVAQAVSYARAGLSGIWHKSQEGKDGNAVEYSRDAIESAAQGIELQESIWERMFHDLRIEPLRLWHEDVLADAAGVAEQVADYLSVELDPSATVNVPAIEKQADADSKAWLERYVRSRVQNR